MTQDEIQAVARAIEDQLTAEEGWMVGTPAIKRMCEDFAQAAIAALDAARGDPVARVVEWLRACSLSSAIPDDPAQMIADLADAIERGEPFNG